MEDKISAVIITFNEAANIERCIHSLTPVVDEIIIVDSYSKDNTVQIATRLGAKVIQTNWLGYGATKNLGNSNAQYNYIFSMDADECLDEELQNSILKIKKLGFQNNYSVNRITNYAGTWVKHCGWYPEIKTRIFNKINTTWNLQAVHEQLINNSNITETLLKGHLLHYSFITVAHHLQKINHYAPLEAKKVLHYSWLKLILKIMFSPIFTFLKKYFLQLGILDGVAGWHISRLSAYASYRRYQLALQLKNKK